MSIVRNFLLVIFISMSASFLLSSCAPDVPDDEHTREIKEWQKRRVEGLKRKDGWFSLAGLYWLKEGVNTFGSDKSNDVVFPEGTPPFIGKIILDNGNVSTVISEDVRVFHDSVEVKEISMQKDTQENTTLLTHGSFSWYAIERHGNRFGIRLKDSESQALKDFDGIDTYPIDKKWKIEARYVPYDPPKKITIPNITGVPSEDSTKGALVFKIDDKEYRLDVLGEGARLSTLFADQTNGEETYGAGRFVTMEKPDSNGVTYIDFNRAYNPPCAFTKYATCPLPPKDNFLRVEITAGEKNYGEHH